MRSAPLFELDAVGVAVDGAVVLDDVTAALPATGITAVAGPSGAGKSTLLRLCNRLEVPTSGRVRFRGEDVAAMDPLDLRRRVGMVFQQPALFGGTVRDNLVVARPDGDDECFASALAAAGLDRSVLPRTASTLSGGEAQRACLARTLVTGPEVLLLDEPTSALDARRTMGFERVAVDLATGGMPMLWVTHDLAQVRRVASHVVAVAAGRVAFAGSLDDPATATALSSFMAGEGDLDAPG